MEAIGLYIHIPFCKSKCGYCDFTSFAGQEARIGEYIDAVIEEAGRYSGLLAETVFLGGGTPAVLPEGEMTRLIEGVRRHIPIQPGAEFTIEVNPNSVTGEKLREYRALGANRISMGLQSADGGLLKAIGRTHTYEDFLEAIQLTREAGIENINADVMYSLPEQTVEQVADTVKKAAAQPLTHISAYALKLERRTPMYGASQPDEDTDREMFHTAKALLEERGFLRYEISNFAKEGYQCRHNLKYWRVEPYLGLGLAAHSMLGGSRFANTDSLSAYLKRLKRGKSPQVTREEVRDGLGERIMLQTRLTEGMEASALPASPAVQQCLGMLERNGLIQAGERVALTDKGMDVQNAIVVALWDAMEEKR